MFDSESLIRQFKCVMIETVIAHNRAMVQLNLSLYVRNYYWGETSSKSSEFLDYASWDRDFREAVQDTIQSVVVNRLAEHSIYQKNIARTLEWVGDAEFALRAQLSRNLLWGLSQSLQMLPRRNDDCWYAGSKKNGYLIKFRDPERPTESEFGRYVVGRRDGRFLCFFEGQGWKIHEFELKHACPVNVRRARNTEIYFDESLDGIAKRLAGQKIIGAPSIRHPYKQWENVCAPQYALPL
jgi:hypothetical protein